MGIRRQAAFSRALGGRGGRGRAVWRGGAEHVPRLLVWDTGGGERADVRRGTPVVHASALSRVASIDCVSHRVRGSVAWALSCLPCSHSCEHGPLHENAFTRL